MEAKKKSPPATAAAGAGAQGAAPPAANGYFSSYFPASPAGNAKDAKSADLYAMLNKQSSRGQNGSGIAGKSQGRPTYKDGKHVHNESSESPYFGSSVHYGGRDFYNSSPQKQSFEPPRNYNEDDSDGSATRDKAHEELVRADKMGFKPYNISMLTLRMAVLKRLRKSYRLCMKNASFWERADKKLKTGRHDAPSTVGLF